MRAMLLRNRRSGVRISPGALKSLVISGFRLQCSWGAGAACYQTLHRGGAWDVRPPQSAERAITAARTERGTDGSSARAACPETGWAGSSGRVRRAFRAKGRTSVATKCLFCELSRSRQAGLRGACLGRGTRLGTERAVHWPGRNTSPRATSLGRGDSYDPATDRVSVNRARASSRTVNGSGGVGSSIRRRRSSPRLSPNARRARVFTSI
jgi:hypothetical protein